MNPGRQALRRTAVRIHTRSYCEPRLRHSAILDSRPSPRFSSPRPAAARFSDLAHELAEAGRGVERLRALGSSKTAADYPPAKHNQSSRICACHPPSLNGVPPGEDAKRACRPIMPRRLLQAANSGTTARYRGCPGLPIVIDSGKHDAFAPFLSRIAAGMRAPGCVNLRVETIKGAAHYVAKEEPEAVEEVIERYAGVGVTRPH
jgi:pimeloyl-ACP methyl ester carboxylesterase